MAAVAPVVDITELVKANATFIELASALRLSEDAARHMLHGAMEEAGTHPGIITAEDVWFMMPSIETDVLAHFVDQDATVRRDQVNEMLRRSRYESYGVAKKAERERETRGVGVQKLYARLA